MFEGRKCVQLVGVTLVLRLGRYEIFLEKTKEKN